MDPFLGQIILFAGNFAPHGWAFCEGQLLSMSANSALYSVLGTTYGGDGRTTFALPDLRGRAPIGFGQGPGLSFYVLGEVTGVENVALTQSQMPAHTHALEASTAAATTAVPTGNLLAEPPAIATDRATVPVESYVPGAPNTALSAASIGNAGGSQPHTNIPPVLAMNYIIALEGSYPMRGD